MSARAMPMVPIMPMAGAAPARREAGNGPDARPFIGIIRTIGSRAARGEAP